VVFTVHLFLYYFTAPVLVHYAHEDTFCHDTIKRPRTNREGMNRSQLGEKQQRTNVIAALLIAAMAAMFLSIGTILTFMASGIYL